MANWQDPQTTGVNIAATASVPRAARDAGLRSYMLSVYNYMASGVLLTGIVALLFANSSLINYIVDPATGRATLLFWVALFAPLGLVMWLSYGINRMSASTAQMAATSSDSAPRKSRAASAAMPVTAITRRLVRNCPNLGSLSGRKYSLASMGCCS